MVRDLVGEAYVRSEPAMLSGLPDGWPDVLVATPGSEAEVCALVRCVERARGAILPRGGGTQIHTGYPPPVDRLLLVMDTTRLDRVEDYQPDDMTITCGAGITLSALQRTMQTRHQFLPLDVPLPERATVGGIVSTNATGFWRAAYGAPRDLLIGVRAVMAGGEVVRGGGRVVKNVAGYDVCKLFTGAWGTLGIVTELTFRIRPLPEQQMTWRFVAPDLATAVRTGLQIHAANLAVTFLVATNELEGVPSLILGVHGTSSRAEWQYAECARIAAEAGVKTPAEVVPEDQIAMLRDRQARLNCALGLRASCLLTDLLPTIERLEQCDNLALTAHCMTGTLSIGTQNDAQAPTTLLNMLPEGTNVLWTRLPSSVLSAGDVAVWGTPRGDFHLHRALKKALDPEGVFSPGRFLGRL
ncbi:MAG: FAD-binding oxidoreductase [Chloroherpetonaceae bacterium]|nr:FAD-binding oxidoreductase [Chthonomonadaceae bacterium]MDW8209142.1 FAD-binding oxidoreductase [Chloroherpetonaceae bacterium]